MFEAYTLEGTDAVVYDVTGVCSIVEGDQIVVEGDLIEVRGIVDAYEYIEVTGYSHIEGDTVTVCLDPWGTVDLWSL